MNELPPLTARQSYTPRDTHTPRSDPRQALSSRQSSLPQSRQSQRGTPRPVIDPRHFPRRDSGLQMPLPLPPMQRFKSLGRVLWEIDNDASRIGHDKIGGQGRGLANRLAKARHSHGGGEPARLPMLPAPPRKTKPAAKATPARSSNRTPPPPPQRSPQRDTRATRQRVTLKSPSLASQQEEEAFGSRVVLECGDGLGTIVVSKQHVLSVGPVTGGTVFEVLGATAKHRARYEDEDAVAFSVGGWCIEYGYDMKLDVLPGIDEGDEDAEAQQWVIDYRDDGDECWLYIESSVNRGMVMDVEKGNDGVLRLAVRELDETRAAQRFKMRIVDSAE